MKPLTRTEIQCLASYSHEMPRRAAAELLALRAERKRLRKALVNIASEALYGTQIKKWADAALTAARKPRKSGARATRRRKTDAPQRP